MKDYELKLKEGIAWCYGAVEAWSYAAIRHGVYTRKSEQLRRVKHAPGI